jgi:hypothetical protein
MEIVFLGADYPLTKRFLANGEVEAYPLVKKFTSFVEKVDTIDKFLHQFTKHVNEAHCLLKGVISRHLKNESRRGSTNTCDHTQWVCLDFDRITMPIPQALKLLELENVSHILQYSASHGVSPQDLSSHGLGQTPQTHSAHVFMLLKHPIPAPSLKAWLMHKNLTCLREGICLSLTKSALHWPLDITACQNDKLLYIAPPVFEPPLKDPLKQRITLVEQSEAALAIIDIPDINVVKVQANTLLNELRKAEGLKSHNGSTTWVGEYEVLSKPESATVTGIRQQGEFIRLNLNGGDSWAYWHPMGNFDLIHDFKTDLSYQTKQFLPDYYRQCMEQRSTQASTPSTTGDLILAFRDFYSSAYYNGLWNPETNTFKLAQARNETQVKDWILSHGCTPGDNIPIWEMAYLPEEDWKVDEEKHLINSFQATEFMRAEAKPHDLLKTCPAIHHIITHMLGDDQECVEAFLNWFAVIFQRKAEPKPITAWVLHGTQGTGKGYFFHKIARPLLGLDNTGLITTQTLRDEFNEWMYRKLLVMVDEVDVDDFREKGLISAKLRNIITEPHFPLRAMRQDTRSVPNHAAFIFTANKPHPVIIPHDDRRYNVGTYQPKKITKPNNKMVEKELPLFAEWLRAHKADVKEANTVVENEARENLKELSKTALEKACENIREGKFEELWYVRTQENLLNEIRVPNLQTETAHQYNILMKRIGQEILENPNQVLTRDEIGLILQFNVGKITETNNKLTSLLRHHGIVTKRIRKNNILTYGIKINWRTNKELIADIKQSFKPFLKVIKPIPKEKEHGRT